MQRGGDWLVRFSTQTGAMVDARHLDRAELDHAQLAVGAIVVGTVGELARESGFIDMDGTQPEPDVCGCAS
jgi:hypothetical protein